MTMKPAGTIGSHEGHRTDNLLKRKRTRVASATVSSSGSSGYQNIPSSKSSAAVWAARACFLLTLAGVAASFGGISYYLLTESEDDLTEAQFASIADRAITNSREKIERKRLGIKSLASVVGGANPDASQWPFVVLNNYENIAENLIDVSKGCRMGFAPIVHPSELASFEEFIYDYYENSRMPEPFPNGTAIQPFGKGVWSTTEDDVAFHDTTGVPAWSGGNLTILAPLAQHSLGASPKLLNNLHSNPMLGNMLEHMLQCANDKMVSGESMDGCVAISTIIPEAISWTQGAATGPGASIMQPIYPSNQPSKMVGVIVTAVNWAEIFASTFANAVTGIDIVIQSSSGQTYTYRVVDGEVHVTGEGDLHDTAFDSFAVDIDITQPDLFGPTSEHYSLALYPSKDLYDVYCTKNPRYASLGAVCIIAFTSIMFMCFDFLVRRDSEAKQTLLDAKRKFVRFVSHEVRTPLNSVCMGLTLLKDEITSVLEDADKDTRTTPSTMTKLDRDLETNCRTWLTLADEVAANANSAVDVLNDFLNFDKVESGKLTLEYTVVPIFDLIEETVSEFKLPAAKKKIVVSVRTPLSHIVSSHDGSTSTTSEEQFVVGDKVRLTQVFRNLISNAIKFTPDGGTVMVEAKWIPFSENDNNNNGQHPVLDKPKLFPIRNDEFIICHRSNGSILLTVKDSGVGMTPLQVESVFQQGTQFNVNELQAGNGSGLGTYIAKGIVKQHGGVLSAFSEGLQKGSTFSVSLPIYEIPADHVPESKRTRENNKKVESDPIGSLKILVVDDATMNLKLLMRLLERQGHVTTGAEDGAVAVTLVREALEQNDPYDVILTDYQMPNMDGPTAAREIRRLGCDSFIVGVTGNLMPEDIRYFKQAGANAVLPKPVRLPDLNALLIEYDIRTENEEEKNDLVTTSQRYQMSFSQMEGNLVVASTTPSRPPSVVVQGDEEGLVSSGEP